MRDQRTPASSRSDVWCPSRRRVSSFGSSGRSSSWGNVVDVMTDLLTFRRLLSPIAIQVFFFLGSLVAIIAGLAILMRGIAYHQPAATTLFGVGLLLLGPILVRLYAESVIVIFRINETLTDIRGVALSAADGSGHRTPARTSGIFADR